MRGRSTVAAAYELPAHKPVKSKLGTSPFKLESIDWLAKAGAAELKATARMRANNTPVENIFCLFILVLLLKKDCSQSREGRQVVKWGVLQLLWAPLLSSQCILSWLTSSLNSLRIQSTNCQNKRTNCQKTPIKTKDPEVSKLSGSLVSASTTISF